MIENKTTQNEIVSLANELRWSIGDDFHDKLTEGIYADAANIASKAVIADGQKKGFTFDGAIDKVVTSRTWGFPIMLLMLAVVLWLTIEGANVPSSLLANLLLDTIYPFLLGLATDIGFPWWLKGSPTLSHEDLSIQDWISCLKK